MPTVTDDLPVPDPGERAYRDADGVWQYEGPALGSSVLNRPTDRVFPGNGAWDEDGNPIEFTLIFHPKGDRMATTLRCVGADGSDQQIPVGLFPLALEMWRILEAVEFQGFDDADAVCSEDVITDVCPICKQAAPWPAPDENGHPLPPLNPARHGHLPTCTLGSLLKQIRGQ